MSNNSNNCSKCFEGKKTEKSHTQKLGHLFITHSETQKVDIILLISFPYLNTEINAVDLGLLYLIGHIVDHQQNCHSLTPSMMA